MTTYWSSSITRVPKRWNSAIAIPKWTLTTWQPGMECIMDCKDHKDHDCELKLGYVRLKFTGCGNMCSSCQEAIMHRSTRRWKAVAVTMKDTTMSSTTVCPTATTTTAKSAIGTRTGTAISPVDTAEARGTVATSANAFGSREARQSSISTPTTEL